MADKNDSKSPNKDQNPGKAKADADNHANQLNPNNERFQPKKN